MPELTEDTKAYLEYLDKEMTIMGILSTFCVAAGAVTVERAGSALPTTFFGVVAQYHMPAVLCGSALFMASALSFYLQRAHLAFYYGAICFTAALHEPNRQTVHDVLREMDSWTLWLRYRAGFFFLSLAFLVLSHAAYAAKWGDKCRLASLEWILISASTLVVLIHGAILSTYRYEEHPYEAFSLGAFWNDFRNRKKE
jgi:hypothetical protein